MIHRREFEDKLTMELLKIAHYNLKTSIRLCITLQLQDIWLVDTQHWKSIHKFDIFIPSLPLNVSRQETFPLDAVFLMFLM